MSKIEYNFLEIDTFVSIRPGILVEDTPKLRLLKITKSTWNGGKTYIGEPIAYDEVGAFTNRLEFRPEDIDHIPTVSEICKYADIENLPFKFRIWDKSSKTYFDPSTNPSRTYYIEDYKTNEVISTSKETKVGATIHTAHIPILQTKFEDMHHHPIHDGDIIAFNVLPGTLKPWQDPLPDMLMEVVVNENQVELRSSGFHMHIEPWLRTSTSNIVGNIFENPEIPSKYGGIQNPKFKNIHGGN